MDNVEPEPSAIAMQPEDIAQVAWVSDVDLHPDGERVAFVVSTPSLDRDETISAIWVADIGSDDAPIQFTSGTLRDSHPRWSPDGRLIAFLSERSCPDIVGLGGDKPQIYVMRRDGGEPRRITAAPAGVTQFAWAPDSSRIAFVARVPNTPSADAKPTVAGDRPPSKPFRVIEALKYRRNGEGFVDGRRHLFVSRVDGTVGAVQLTDGDFDHADPAWSPDGGEIAFVSARHHSRDRDNAQSLMAVPVATRGHGGLDLTPARTIAQIGGPIALPAWSPDGTALLFAGHEYPVDTGRHVRVWVVPSVGGEAYCVKDPHDRNVAASAVARPIWAPVENSVLFTVEDDGATVLVEAQLPPPDNSESGADFRVIAGGRREVSSFASRRGAGAIAVVTSDPSSPTEVHIIRLVGSTFVEAPLSAFNRKWCRKAATGSIRQLSVQRGHDQITVWVHLPPGTDEAHRSSVPVLVNIHGGPHAQYGHRFFDEFAVYAGAGFAVVYTNPRGSTGRDEAFARAVRGDWGGIDADDVLAALDMALSNVPCLDASRLGLMGGSYGGYLTSWIVARDHRFRAACSERAVNDFGSFAGTSDIGFWFAEGQLGVSPFSDPLVASRHSPLTYASDIRTPLLIMHSELDFRCPIEQAERLYVALASRHHDVRFVRVPDADHELSRSGRPRQRVERFRHILNWFQAHLQEGR